jgi:SAM-dependent methyltransferase
MNHALPGESFPSLFVPLYYAEALLRRRGYESIAREIASRVREGRILDLGAGPGLLSLELVRLSPHVEVLGVDPSPGMVALAKRLCRRMKDRVRFLVGEAYHLPFPPSSFELVVSVGVLHHLLDLPRALKEVRRVLKPGGEAWFYEVVMDAEPEEVVGMLRELRIPLLPFLPLFLVERGLAVRAGRRLVGLRKEDFRKGVLAGCGVERRGAVWKVVVKK